MSSGQWRGHGLIRTGRAFCASSLLRSGSNQSKLKRGAHKGPPWRECESVCVCSLVERSRMSTFYAQATCVETCVYVHV